MAIVDDDVRRVARRYGIDVHGTLWILVEAIRSGVLQPSAADGFVHALRATGARFPTFPSGGIRAWAEHNGMLN